tara:strand:- start:1350 stop:2186 length:837 start_codon:yes stop_codon:yes gene_type:complete
MSVDDQIEIRKIVRNSGSSFYWGMSVLNSEKKRAIFAVYAFCRVVDDIADDTKIKNLKQSKLRSWKLKVENIFKLQKPKTSLERELKFAIEKFKLEKDDFVSVIDGMLMDANQDIKFPSKKRFELYCDRVAVAVGYLVIRIFGLSDINKNYAFFLGRAFQLTNIVRDFYEDLERGRCYIATNYLSRYGIKKNIKTIINEPKLQNIFQDILKEADNYFNKATMESKKIDKKKIIAAEIMKSFYNAIHSKLYNKEIRFKNKVKLGLIEKAYILFIFFVRY